MQMANYFLVAILLEHCLMACLAMATTNITTDQFSLLRFKTHINLDPSHILSKNWSVSTSVCDWIGVTCGFRHQRVTALDISNMNLTGKIPSQLGNLSFLVSINLTRNYFHGSSPQDLNKLRRLKIMDFRFNKFSGKIPSWFHFLPKLQVLDLRENNFTGFIPPSLSNISTLDTLDLSFNPLKGNIPEDIGNLHSLRILGLQYNRLTGVIPLQIFNISTMEIFSFTGNSLTGNLPLHICHGFPRLRGLHLSKNEFVGEIPSNLSECLQLQVLSLSFNKFSGSIPGEIGRIRTLQGLALGSNDLSGTIPRELGNLDNLKLLSMGSNFLNGSIPTSIFNISSLQYIAIQRCSLSGNLDPNSIANSSKVTTIILDHNNFNGPIPNFLGNLCFIEILDLSDNNFISEYPEFSFITSLTNCRYLTLLDIGNNPLNGILPLSIGNLSTSLQYLDGHNCDLKGSIPYEIGNLTSLIRLTLFGNELTGSIPASVVNLQKLQGLSLTHNKISGSIPNSLCELQNLCELVLSQNLITGAIPGCIGNITALRSLYIDTNRLTSIIPTSLWLQKDLLELNLSTNTLSGSLPEEIGNLKVACLIDLSANRFFGSIPSAIGDLLTLSNLSLAHNTLQGSIPESMAYAIERYRRKHLVENGVDSAPGTNLRVSYYELLQATEGYSESHLLGTGSLGSVYKGTLNNGRDVAVKVFNLQQQNAFKSFDVECEVLRNLRHRNLCKVISTCSNPDFKALVLEHMSNGSLEKWLYSDDYVLDIVQRINILIDVAYALEYLHYGYSLPIVHCDLKPSNVLLDEDFVAHLSDFGIAKLLGEGESNAYTTTLGTLGYIAPEYGMEGLVSIKCDIYSYGIMLMEVFTRMKPSDEKFSGDFILRSWINDSMPDAITQIIDSNLLGPGELNTKKLKCLSSVMELALNCTMESASERMNIKEVVVALKNFRFQLLT
ncbi:probable LRR receptor-like serine/threonine-protein kinase At3g47570 isoform X3 [Olea europaea var. sylvestris]|uniref:probable LRR receptor-like serine/threonine-protein kinase At3g47570 isoform X3 n=1 Tax=Olea europaea var. sylvestris TaxID=158386 RepID=UPI000C1CFC16|nr:probable LRR receptor-like serine/threonine-protein kinase At3g47570 isoform X3 [Olea europaea var. sylvestris]